LGFQNFFNCGFPFPHNCHAIKDFVILFRISRLKRVFKLSHLLYCWEASDILFHTCPLPVCRERLLGRFAVFPVVNTVALVCSSQKGHTVVLSGARGSGSLPFPLCALRSSDACSSLLEEIWRPENVSG
jgi:hypothetical protein